MTNIVLYQIPLGYYTWFLTTFKWSAAESTESKLLVLPHRGRWGPWAALTVGDHRGTTGTHPSLSPQHHILLASMFCPGLPKHGAEKIISEIWGEINLCFGWVDILKCFVNGFLKMINTLANNDTINDWTHLECVWAAQPAIPNPN